MRYSILTLVFVILLDAFIFYDFAMQQNEMIYEFEQRQQDIQVNYAVDAATTLMLFNTNDIYLDYTDLQEVFIDPEVALETYEGIMVRYYGWGDDNLTRKYFEDTLMPFFIVCAYDGYYVYGVINKEEELTLNDGTTSTSTTYPKEWSPKIPFAEGNWDATKPEIYLYTLGAKEYTLYDYTEGTYTSHIPYKEGLGFGTKSNASMVVANAITDACNKALLLGSTNSGDNKIIIPNSFSEWSSNRPIEYPTVLTYLDTNRDNLNNYSTPTFAIGGSRISMAEYYICYTQDGIKKYTYSTNRPYIEAEGLVVEKIYSSAFDCAEDGYYFDLNYLE